jgi:hypothetical protein
MLVKICEGIMTTTSCVEEFHKVKRRERYPKGDPGP